MTIFDEYKTYTGDSSISSPPCFGSMTCHILTGGNPGRLWYSVSLKEDG